MSKQIYFGTKEERRKQADRAYRKAHPEKIKEKIRLYHELHKEKIGDYQKKYHKEYHKEYDATINRHLRKVFSAMRARCSNSKVHNYNRYGGRGIKVLFKTVEEFIDYVTNVLKVDPRGLTIDRINNDGNYKRGNIRFITRAENNRNK